MRFTNLPPVTVVARHLRVAAGLMTLVGGAAQAQTPPAAPAPAQSAPAASDPTKDMQHIDLLAFNRRAVTMSLPLLQKAGAAFNAQMDGKCFSCHNQSLPSAALKVARERGFKYDLQQAAEQTRVVHTIFKQARVLAEKSARSPEADRELEQILVDPSISLGYGLFGLAADGVRPDGATMAAAEYLMRKQAPEGSWPVWTARPPLEGSEFAATALAVRAIKVYAPASAAKDVAQRTMRARTWLLANRPRNNEDRAFRLLGLRWTGAEASDIKSAVADLVAEQNDDGGWGQLKGSASDAYATGQALYALNQGADMPTGNSVYRRGAFFLAVTQQKDGSWLVAKRATAVQPYFDSGFPHEQAQFISCAGTAWATMALALTLPAAAPTQTASAAR